MAIRIKGSLSGCATVLVCFFLAGCAVPQGATRIARNAVVFSDVVAQVKPVAERQCRQQTPRINCRFSISLLRDPSLQPNAYYQRLPSGRPRIVVTEAMLHTVQNADELALILGHEAGHHIAGHFQARSEHALAEALASWIAAEDAGLLGSDLTVAAQAGALKGARKFSKQYELEADRLGAMIARGAGYDPVRGIAYLARAHDPGNQHLGTHPAHAQRIQQMRAKAHLH